MPLYFKGEQVTPKNVEEVEDFIADWADSQFRYMLRALDRSQQAVNPMHRTGPTLESELLLTKAKIFKNDDFVGKYTHVLDILAVEVGWGDNSDSGAYGLVVEHAIKKMRSFPGTFVAVKGVGRRVRVEAWGVDMTKIKGLHITEGT